MNSYLSEHAAGTVLRLKIVPNSSREKIVGILGDALKIAVTAPPEAGKANSAVVKLLEKAFGARVEVVRGHSTARKEVLVAGKKPEEVAAMIESLLADRPITRE
jgi:uncharacterized protein